MAQHKLRLDIPDTLNDCVLRVVDLSSYNPDAEVTCPLLEITLPGYQNPVQFSPDSEPAINPGFMVNLTACNLEIQTESCGTVFAGLPDGIYVMKYSVSPNEYVYVEYNILRITKALNCYNKILCELNIGACEPDTKLKKTLDELRTIRTYLDAAKAQVEECHNPKKGMETYKYALKKMRGLNCASCKSC